MSDKKPEVIEKIQKLLALAGNNPSESEAESAALKAQELIAKHNITMTEIEDAGDATEEEEDLGYYQIHTGNGKAWKFNLAQAIAENFRCKRFWFGRHTVAFYGYETDAQAAREVFTFLFKMGNKLATREVNHFHNRGESATGVYNSYVLGFVHGIKSKLDAQCKALMIVMAPKVDEGYQQVREQLGLTNMRNTGLGSVRGYKDIYDKGYKEGQNAMGRREIECSNC